MNISIIIPTFNEATHISRLIEHLLTHKSTETEIIVVDGGSTDTTIDICQRYDIQLLQTELSRAIQQNKGAEQAQHELLYFIHADTLPPETFEHDIKTAMGNGKSAGAYKSRFEGGSWLMKINAFFTRFMWLTARGGDQSLFIKKDLFIEVGGFDEEMQIMEEYPLIEKLMKNKQFVILNKSILISTRKYENRSWFQVNRANYIAFKMFKKGESSARIKKRYHELLK